MHRLSTYVIVHRTQSDQTADGNRLDGERNPIGRRTESDWMADAKDRGCSCLSCTNQANRTTKVNDTNVGGYGILAVVTLPPAVIFSHR